MRDFQATTFGRLLACALVLSSFAFASRTLAQGSDTYKIGVVVSQTGPGSFLGDPFAKGAKLAVERANAEGGINGKKIEFVSYDDETSADKALIFAKKLIGDDKVPI
ncbi:MAG: ABC transporter substrate-binding protein, partial [Candidatus Binatia bacterium]